jgi:hypothetical protein
MRAIDNGKRQWNIKETSDTVTMQRTLSPMLQLLGLWDACAPPWDTCPTIVEKPEAGPCAATQEEWPHPASSKALKTH